jgi:hypothetical protein
MHLRSRSSLQIDRHMQKGLVIPLSVNHLWLLPQTLHWGEVMHLLHLILLH